MTRDRIFALLTLGALAVAGCAPAPISRMASSGTLPSQPETQFFLPGKDAGIADSNEIAACLTGLGMRQITANVDVSEQTADAAPLAPVTGYLVQYTRSERSGKTQINVGSVPVDPKLGDPKWAGQKPLKGKQIEAASLVLTDVASGKIAFRADGERRLPVKADQPASFTTQMCEYLGAVKAGVAATPAN